MEDVPSSCPVTLTKGQFEPCVQQDLVRSRVPGATDLLILQQDFGLQGRPLPRAFLRRRRRRKRQGLKPTRPSQADPPALWPCLYKLQFQRASDG